MSDPLFEFFNRDRPSVDPESPGWKKIHSKEYPRARKVPLPRPELPEHVTLRDALKKRKSERNFSSRPLSQNDLGALLFWSAGLIHSGEKENLRRPHPSGGARFPIELYAAFLRPEDLDTGVYHYNIREHALERVQNASAERIKELAPYDFIKNAAALLLLTFVGRRTLEKYGSLGYKLGLLEAGHIGQNISLVASSLGLGALSVGSMRDDREVEKELDLEDDESLMYELAVGHPVDK